MILWLRFYKDGSRFVYFTDNDGDHEKVVEGFRKPGAVMCVNLTVAYDDTDDAKQTALRAIEFAKGYFAGIPITKS